MFNGKPVAYPYAYLTLNTLAGAEDRQNASSTARRGLMGTVSTDSKRYFKVHFMPADFEVGIELVTNRYEDLLRYGNTWMFARRRGWLKFEVAYGSASFGVGVDMDPSVAYPQREADPEGVQEYVMSASLAVRGYISDPVLVEGQVKDTVMSAGSLASEADTMWSFANSRDKAFDSKAVPEVPTNMR